jgi:hypothetical protein
LINYKKTWWISKYFAGYIEKKFNYLGEKTMDSVKLRSHVGTDGILHLEIPIGMTDKEVEVMVIYQASESPTQQKTSENLGYPPGFFEQTYGICADDPIVIDSEGDFEEREEI